MLACVPVSVQQESSKQELIAHTKCCRVVEKCHWDLSALPSALTMKPLSPEKEEATTSHLTDDACSDTKSVSEEPVKVGGFYVSIIGLNIQSSSHLCTPQNILRGLRLSSDRIKCSILNAHSPLLLSQVLSSPGPVAVPAPSTPLQSMALPESMNLQQVSAAINRGVDKHVALGAAGSVEVRDQQQGRPNQHTLPGEKGKPAPAPMSSTRTLTTASLAAQQAAPVASVQGVGEGASDVTSSAVSQASSAKKAARNRKQKEKRKEKKAGAVNGGWEAVAEGLAKA